MLKNVGLEIKDSVVTDVSLTLLLSNTDVVHCVAVHLDLQHHTLFDC